MRRSQDPFVENSEAIAQVGLKMPLKIERHLERYREVLRRNDHDHRYGRNLTKISIRHIHFQQPAQHLILGTHRLGCAANSAVKLDQ